LRVILLHPQAAARSCEDCRKYLYNDRPGDFAEKPLVRAGKPVPRPANASPPCCWCDKQPPDVPETERTPATACELSEQNWQAYQFHRGCEAVGRFPNDPIVRRNGAVIREAVKAAETMALTMGLVKAGLAGKR
jgi:hypothetical protein